MDTDPLDSESEDILSAMDRLNSSKKKGEVIHQGVTIPYEEEAGPSTRAGTRRASEDNPGTTRKARKKPASRFTFMPDRSGEEQRPSAPAATPEPTDPGPSQGQQPGCPDGWTQTILIDIQKTVTDTYSKLTTIDAQLIQDRQRMDNLSLRVESLQQARMQGLIIQEKPSQVSVPSSGQTLHVRKGGGRSIEL